MTVLTEPSPHNVSEQTRSAEERRAHLLHAVHHTAHMLSEQGPMNVTFVHNNTLLGLQKQHFHDAIATAHTTLGLAGYEPDANFLKAFAEGRIADTDLDESLKMQPGLVADLVKARLEQRAITSGDIIKAILRSDAATGSSMDAMRSSFDPESGRLCLGAEEKRLIPGLRADGLAAIERDSATVGRSATLGEWLGRHFGIPVQRIIERTIREGHVSVPKSSASVQMDRMGIPASLQASYMTRAREVWGADCEASLAVEQRIVARIAEVLLFCQFSLSAIVAAFRAQPEGYALRAIYTNVCEALKTTDPLLPIDQGTLAVKAASSVDDVLPERMLDPTELIDLALLRDLIEKSSSPRELARLDAVCVSGTLPDDMLHQLRGLAEVATDVGLKGRIRLIAGMDSAEAFEVRLSAIVAAEVDSLASHSTFGDLVTRLTGVDVIQKVNANMVGHLAAFTDEGLASLRMPDRDQGLFNAWRAAARTDSLLMLEADEGWRDRLDLLPRDPADALIRMLDDMGIPEEAWENYLGKALVHLKGWAGMMFWMETHPKHVKQRSQSADTIQYLAMRVFTEREVAGRILGDVCAIRPVQAEFASWAKNNQPEVYVRLALNNGELERALAEEASLVLSMRPPKRRDKVALSRLARLHWQTAGRQSTFRKVAQENLAVSRVVAQLGLGGADVAACPALAQSVLEEMEGLSEARRGRIWLEAYEVHYRDEVLNALSQNKGMGRWIEGRKKRPKSQVVFCIDEREENLHRYYAELDPDHETLGAAGFFGIAIAHSPLGGHDTTPLCPAVATPAHCIAEVPRDIALDTVWPVAQRRTAFGDAFKTVMWEAGRNPVMAFVTTQVTGLFHAVPLVGRVLAPRSFKKLSDNWVSKVVPHVPTRLTHQKLNDHDTARYGLHVSGLPFGFTVVESADRIEAQLRNWGLTYQFAKIVVICAHRSFSVNNPHENAHDCGACGGKAGGPNARLFAALANEPDVRAELRTRGIDIPADTWFVGAEHNTCNDEILTFDTEDIPENLAAEWDVVSGDLRETSARAARERCRRFRSAPKDASPAASWAHVQGRSQDLSQVRPEWGHATNAFALVGRRALTQGLFFDRRGFVISYDPTQDGDGKILERILMAVGPVGAGINLEYYFSTVNPDGYGSGTKVPHNVVGMIGVMPGAKGDLATGLPRQMTEVHEAMRLQLIVDAPMHILGEIYGRQPAIQELLNGQWVHLIAHDPATCTFHRFVPGVGFVQWNKELVPLPEVKESYEWIRGKHDCFLPPARVHEPESRWTGLLNEGSH